MLAFRSRSRGLATLLCAAAAFAAIPASAAPLKFVFTGSIAGTLDIDSNPTPIATDPGNFFITRVTGGTGAFAAFAPGGTIDLGFGTSSYFFNFGILNAPFGDSFQGASLFSGSENAPTINTGTYAMLGQGSGVSTLTISVASPGAPAPAVGASWAAAFAAALALVVTRLRRRPLAA